MIIRLQRLLMHFSASAFLTCGRVGALLLLLMLLTPASGTAEPRQRPANSMHPAHSPHPAHRERRLDWVTGTEDRSSGDHPGLQMSREERRALRRELHESRNELRRQRRESPAR